MATATGTSSAPEIQPDGDFSAYNGAAAAEPAHAAPTPSSAKAGTAHVTFVSSPEFRIEAAVGPSNHQFWLKDAKIAEDLFTVRNALLICPLCLFFVFDPARCALAFTQLRIGH